MPVIGIIFFSFFISANKVLFPLYRLKSKLGRELSFLRWMEPSVHLHGQYQLLFLQRGLHRSANVPCLALGSLSTNSHWGSSLVI